MNIYRSEKILTRRIIATKVPWSRKDVNTRGNNHHGVFLLLIPGLSLPRIFIFQLVAQWTRKERERERDERQRNKWRNLGNIHVYSFPLPRAFITLTWFRKCLQCETQTFQFAHSFTTLKVHKINLTNVPVTVIVVKPSYGLLSGNGMGFNGLIVKAHFNLTNVMRPPDDFPG